MNYIVIISLLLILGGILLPGLTVTAAVPVFSLVVFFWDRGVFLRMGGIKFWLLFAAGTVILPIFGGGNSVQLFWGLQYSIDLFLIGLRVVARGYLMFMGLMLIRRHVPLQNLSLFLMKVGLNKLSVLIPLAFHLIPEVIENTKDTFMIWRQRGGFRKNRIRNILLLLTCFQIRWVREAENLSLALILSSHWKGESENLKKNKIQG